MQPNNPTSLIPAAHLPVAVNTIANTQSNNPNITSLIQDLQNQINKITGQVIQEELPDVILVNPSGRVVAVSGRNSAEYLSKAGFRKATPAEEDNYNKAVMIQTQEFLRRLERKRIVDEKLFMDELEKEGLIDEPVSTESLLRATVTDAQKTGALEPDQVAKLNTKLPQPTVPDDVASTNVTGGLDTNKNSSASTSDTPPSRKANKTLTTTTTTK